MSKDAISFREVETLLLDNDVYVNGANYRALFDRLATADANGHKRLVDDAAKIAFAAANVELNRHARDAPRYRC